MGTFSFRCPFAIAEQVSEVKLTQIQQIFIERLITLPPPGTWPVPQATPGGGRSAALICALKTEPSL